MMESKVEDVMVDLDDDSQATKTMVDIVYGCCLDLSQKNPEALSALIKKSRDDHYNVIQPNLGELAQMNLIRLNGISHPHIVPIVVTMFQDQTENFKPVHPSPDKK